jgi:hypothetical protein
MAHRFRWLIAVVVGVLLMMIEIPLGLDVSGSTVYAGIVWLIAESLKNNIRPEDKR